MAEGEPNVSRAQSEIDAHLAERAEQDRKDLLDELLIGDGIHHESHGRTQVVHRRDGKSYERTVDVKGKALNREEKAQRIEDAREYYEHLGNLSDRGGDFDPYEQDLLNSAHAEALAENADRDAAIQGEKDRIAGLEANIESDPRFRRLVMVIDKIKELRSHAVDEGEDEAALQQELRDQEQKFQELFDKYEAEGADHATLEHILDKVYSAQTAESATETTGSASGDESVAESSDEATGGEGSPSESEGEEVKGSPAETQSSIEIKLGDRVSFKDREGNSYEGILESTRDVFNEDYVMYFVRTDDGEEVMVSYAELTQTAEVVGAGVGAEGAGSEEEGTGEDVDDLSDLPNPTIPDEDETNDGSDKKEKKRFGNKLWGGVKTLFGGPNAWAAAWTTNRAIQRDIKDSMTDEEKEERRKKNRVLYILGGIGGAAALATIGVLIAKGYLDSQQAQDAAKELGDAAGEALSDLPDVPETFPIEPGDGMTQGIQNALGEIGYDMTPDQYWQLHQELTNQFGPNYIINRGVPSNNMFVDPNSSFVPGVTDYIAKFGREKGIW